MHTGGARAVLGSLLAAALVLPMSVGTAAAARVDEAGPKLDTPSVAEFVTGEQVTEGPLETNAHIPARVWWKARDRSGVCGVDVRIVRAGGPPTPVLTDGPAVGEFVAFESDYDDQGGGGTEKVMGWWVTAEDCAGNSTTNFVSGMPVAVQEDNSTAGYGSGQLSYSGEWAAVACADCQYDAAAHTSQPGAAVQIPAPAGAQVALVLRQGPQYGVAQIFIEGKRAAQVSTYAAEPTERTIVWSTQLGETQSQITVVNKANGPGSSALALDCAIFRTPFPEPYPPRF